MRATGSFRSLPVSAFALLGLLGVSSAVTINCKDVIVNQQPYNFEPLKGPHAVHWIRQEDPAVRNFTFTVDLCAPLKKKTSSKNECPQGTNVCGVESVSNDGTSIIEKVVPIAGSFTWSSGKSLDPKWTRLKNAAGNSDPEKDGLLLEMNGGRYPSDDKKGKPQKAIVEFLCNPKKTGLEGDEDGGYEDDKESPKGKHKLRRNGEGDKKDDGDKKGDGDKKDGDKKEEGEKPASSLNFVSYKDEDGTDVLRLKWETKVACVGENKNVPQGEHWGFFTWLIIIVFLGTATYLIFGSWLNYNRYGARGWDLLPHGDTIRDIPYYLKDFARRIAGTFQSPARRGGYSAV